MTNCNPDKISFPGIKNKKIEVEFIKDDITSDGGCLLLRAIDKKIQLTEKIAKIMPDDRNQNLVSHSILNMLKQRIYGLALGYEDLNDHNELRNDPALQTAIDTSNPLASSSTLCRLENTANRKVAADINKIFVEQFINSYKSPPKEIILDFDATDDAVYGNQENKSFHGYYGHHCFLPLLVFCGKHLLTGYLRPSNIDGAKHAWAILSLLVKYIRSHWPKVKIIFRGDSGFCRDKMLLWSERNDVDYIVGIARNNNLNKLSEALFAEAKDKFEETNIKQRKFTEFQYAAKSWRQQRRVISKVEYNTIGENRRYIVTTLKYKPQEAYDKYYCERANMENRIKELKLDLFSGRTSCSDWWANNLRLLLSCAAYILIDATRRIALSETKLKNSYCSTIRLALYKVGAVIIRNTRRIKFLMSSHYPNKGLFVHASEKLCPG